MPAARRVQSTAASRYFTTYASPPIINRSSRAPDLPALSIGRRSGGTGEQVVDRRPDHGGVRHRRPPSRRASRRTSARHTAQCPTRSARCVVPGCARGAPRGGRRPRPRSACTRRPRRPRRETGRNDSNDPGSANQLAIGVSDLVGSLPVEAPVRDGGVEHDVVGPGVAAVDGGRADRGEEPVDRRGFGVVLVMVRGCGRGFAAALQRTGRGQISSTSQCTGRADPVHPSACSCTLPQQIAKVPGGNPGTACAVFRAGPMVHRRVSTMSSCRHC